jgi:arsenate reductase
MTDAVKIYHNPRCSKSRDTLSLLKSNGIDPDVVLYLDTPPDAQTLRQLLHMLGMGSARELMRQKEDLYKSLNLDDTYLSEDQLIQAMVENPKLIERPMWWQTAKHASAVRRKTSSRSSSPYAAALPETPAAYSPSFFCVLPRL